MEYRASAAVPLIDPELAIPGLRRQLLVLADVDQATIDWHSLQVAGPVEIVGAHGRVCYEWTATVRATAPLATHEAQPMTVVD